MCSMEESIAKRNHGKEARKALKSPHTSGRMGQARVAENLRQQNPRVDITRTQTWLATQTPKNGSARCEYRERVASLYEDNPSIANKDLDHDAVALILSRAIVDTSKAWATEFQRSPSSIQILIRKHYKRNRNRKLYYKLKWII